MNKVIEQTLTLSGYEYNWDGNWGLPVRPDALSLVWEVFGGHHHWTSLKYCPEPSVMLMEDGTIALGFMHGEGGPGTKELYLKFITSSLVLYTKYFEDGQTSIEGEIRFGTENGPKEFEDLLFWMASE